MKTKLFWRKLRTDKRGFSLVELLCTIGILATITTAIGGAMVVSSTTYKQGTDEVNLQKSAQFTANLIEELIVDATSSVNFDASSKTLVIENTDYTHTIVLAGEQLQYSRKNTVTGAVDPGSILAEKVQDFDVDTSDFAVSRNAQVKLKMKNGEKNLATVYNITSRNNPKSSHAVSFTQGATISSPPSVVLEPGQGYALKIQVNTTGGAIGGFDFVLYGNDDSHTTAVKDGDFVNVEIGANEKGSFNGGRLFLEVRTKAINPSTGTYASSTTEIKIRRVTDFDMPAPTLVSGSPMKENAVYRVYATPTGTNLDQVFGAVYEDTYDYKGTTVSAYVSPYTATWAFEMNSSTPGETWADYVDVQTFDEANAPYIQFRLKKDIAVGDSLTIVASSKHSRGTVSGTAYNRTGSFYETVEARQKLKTGNLSLAGDFLRGDDFSGLVESIDWEDIKAQFGGTRPFRVLRYCPAKLNEKGEILAYTGTWSDWIDFTEKGTGGCFVRPEDMDLNPSLAYAVEVKIQYGYSKDNITWPKASTPEDEYMLRFTVPAVTIVFNYYYDWAKNGANPIYFPVGTDGWSEADRMKIKKDELNRFYVTATAAHMAKLLMANNEILTYKLQRKDTTGWVNVDRAQEFGWEYVNDDTGSMKLKLPATPGIYRFELSWNQTKFEQKWTPCLPYVDETTGKGIFYFEVVNN